MVRVPRGGLRGPATWPRHLTAALWEKTFSDERDQRAGDGANPQKRGQVTRLMQVELAARINEALDGDR